MEPKSVDNIIIEILNSQHWWVWRAWKPFMVIEVHKGQQHMLLQGCWWMFSSNDFFVYKGLSKGSKNEFYIKINVIEVICTV